MERIGKYITDISRPKNFSSVSGICELLWEKGKTTVPSDGNTHVANMMPCRNKILSLITSVEGGHGVKNKIKYYGQPAFEVNIYISTIVCSMNAMYDIHTTYILYIYIYTICILYTITCNLILQSSSRAWEEEPSQMKL